MICNGSLVECKLFSYSCVVPRVAHPYCLHYNTDVDESYVAHHLHLHYNAIIDAPVVGQFLLMNYNDVAVKRLEYYHVIVIMKLRCIYLISTSWYEHLRIRLVTSSQSYKYENQ
jgi:hypothetical protein